MDMFSLAFTPQSNTSSSGTSYQYPDVEEFSTKELLMLEKESSGMYFSGHLIDDYNNHLSALAIDKISDILEDFEVDDDNPERRYKEDGFVKIGGIITAKKTKTLKNGDTMAFLLVEDRVAEIEIIVFAKQYSKFAPELFEENAVEVSGKLTYDDGDVPKIILSSVSPLLSNTAYSEKAKDLSQNEVAPKKATRVFIRLAKFDSEKLTPIYRIATLHSGKCEVIIFDQSTNKYVSMKNVRVSDDENVIERLKSLFGAENVVMK
jgi:DNA polymerase-3 subunit alpha